MCLCVLAVPCVLALSSSHVIVLMLLLLIDILMLLLFDFFIFSPSFIHFLIIRVAFVASLLAIRGQKKEELTTPTTTTMSDVYITHSNVNEKIPLQHLITLNRTCKRKNGELIREISFFSI